MKKTLIVVLCMISAAVAVQAHEFWLQADKYFLSVGERLKVRFMVGENFMGEAWDLKRHKIEKLELHEGNTVRNLSDSVNAGTGFLQTTFKEPGSKLIAMQSNKAYIELDSEKFNEYLKEDGLDNVIELRKKNNWTNKPSREFYSRYTKLFIQVGELRDDVHKKEIGFPIEIISDKNPYSVKQGDVLKFRILFRQQPLFGVKVRIWNRFENRTTIQNIFTEKDGTIEMRISNAGPWMISVVRMEASKDPKADWESFWGSFVFAVK